MGKHAYSSFVLGCTLSTRVEDDERTLPRQDSRLNRKLTGKANLYKDKSYASRYQRNEEDSAFPSRLTAGDYVKLRQLDDSTGLIEEILPRQSELLRKDA